MRANLARLISICSLTNDQTNDLIKVREMVEKELYELNDFLTLSSRGIDRDGEAEGFGNGVGWGNGNGWNIPFGTPY